ncbi:MAG: Hsp20/alpha crystallin family protein [Bacilli bacterium]
MDLIPRNFFLEDVFDDFLTSRETNNLKCDIYEKNNKYYIEMDTPGFGKEDLNIECDNGYLTIIISKADEKNDEEKNYIRRERYTKEYKRSFYIGNVENENIKAEFKNGSLKIEIPKRDKENEKKIIEIE